MEIFLMIQNKAYFWIMQIIYETLLKIKKQQVMPYFSTYAVMI